MPICKHDEPFDEVHNVLYFFPPGAFCCETVKKEEFTGLMGYATEDPMAGMGAMYRKYPNILFPISGEFDVAP